MLTGPDQFFGWIHMLKLKTYGLRILNPGERPPFPIIIERPTIKDVLQNLNFADFGMLVTFSTISLFVARRCVGLYSASEIMRKKRIVGLWTTGSLFGLKFALQNSDYRLRGFQDNGLQWKKKEQTLEKYDFLSDFEQGTIWQYFRK
ncbi:hypothetical protein pb186bvf_010283 [Paramecium bursaria]